MIDINILKALLLGVIRLLGVLELSVGPMLAVVFSAAQHFLSVAALTAVNTTV